MSINEICFFCMEINVSYIFELYEEKIFYMFLGGVLFIYIYFNKLFIELL